jgi:hypothetical protein
MKVLFHLTGIGRSLIMARLYSANYLSSKYCFVPEMPSTSMKNLKKKMGNELVNVSYYI